MENSFLRRFIIGICIVLGLALIAYLVFEAVNTDKSGDKDGAADYKGFTRRYPLDDVSVMIPDDFEVVYPEQIDEIAENESMIVPYDEYYVWEGSTYKGMVSVTKERNGMEPRAYMEASAIPTYEEYYSQLGFKVISRQAGTIAGYPAAALTFEYSVDYQSGQTITYHVYNTFMSYNGYLYMITFHCENWDFENRKPVFDKIAESMEIGVSKPNNSQSSENE